MSRPLKSYHFDVGNSNKGSIGMCLRIRAKSKKQAVRIANECLNRYSAVPVADNEDRVEYCEVYLNGNLTTKDIDSYDEVTNDQ
jgi:hypothetical protein